MENESPRSKNGSRKALIIGISKYDHNNKFRDLDFCENDANEVYNIMKDQHYDIPENRLLVKRVEWSKMRDEIIRFFRDRKVKPDDTLFFYFSGHGYLDKNTGRTYLATSEIDPEWPEMKAIPFEELTTYMNLCNSERVTTVLDCCYSGALEVGGGKGEEEGEYEESTKSEKGEEIASLANTNLDRTVKRLIKSGQGTCVLASSLEEQRSFKMEDQPYSTFTYFLIQGLKGAKGESVNDNGYVTPELLGSYVNKKIYELPAIKQKPIRKIEATGQIILAHYPELAKQKRKPSKFLDDYRKKVSGNIYNIYELVRYWEPRFNKEEEMSIAEIESFEAQFYPKLQQWLMSEQEEDYYYSNRIVPYLDKLDKQVKRLKEKIHSNNDLSAVGRKESILTLQKSIAQTLHELEKQTPP